MGDCFSKYIIIVLLATCLFLEKGVAQNKNLFSCQNGEITFISYAPLEVITAKTKELQGVIDPSNQSFFFSVNVSTFHGFNSGLQQIHFNENYLETETYPKATFEGKIIEPIDFSTPGKYEVRAKGILTIHGIPQERIIKGNLEVYPDHLSIESKFTVALEDHQIKVPKVVYQKIAPEINVTLDAELKKSLK